MSVYVLLMTGIEVSHNSGIPASKDNLVSSVQADGNGNMSLALSDLDSEVAPTLGRSTLALALIAAALSLKPMRSRSPLLLP